MVHMSHKSYIWRLLQVGKGGLISVMCRVSLRGALAKHKIYYEAQPTRHSLRHNKDSLRLNVLDGLDGSDGPVGLRSLVDSMPMQVAFRGRAHETVLSGLGA